MLQSMVVLGRPSCAQWLSNCALPSGGAFSVSFNAQWESLQPWSRITDFGSGPQMSNIFVANKGCKDTLTFQSPKEILDLSKLIEDLRNGNTNTTMVLKNDGFVKLHGPDSSW